MSAFPAGALATRRWLHFRDSSGLAEIKGLLGRGGREQVHDPGDDSRPSGLVARSETGPVVTVEVLVEQEVVAPVRVLLKLLRPAVDGPPTMAVSQEDAGQPPRDLLGDLVQVHISAGARRTFDGEILAV